MSGITKITIKLRKLKDADAPLLVKHLKSGEVSKYTANIPHPYTRKDALAFIQKAKLKSKEKKEFHFAVCLKSGELIGMIALIEVDSKNKRSEVGYWIAKPYWRQGIGLESLNLMLKFGFNKLSLQRISAKVMHPNKPSQMLLRKAGFKEESKMRRYFFKNKIWNDAVIFGLLKEEYKRS